MITLVIINNQIFISEANNFSNRIVTGEIFERWSHQNINLHLAWVCTAQEFFAACMRLESQIITTIILKN